MDITIDSILLNNVKLFVDYFNIWMVLFYGGSFILSLIYHLVRHKKIKFPIYKYSRVNTYLFLSLFVFSAIIASSYVGDVRFFLWFVIVGFVGMLAEATYSLFWRIFFAKNNWTYTKLPLFNAFTSWYNFIPWSVGLVIFLRILLIFSQFIDVSYFIFESFYFLIIGLLLSILFVCGGLIRKYLLCLGDMKFSMITYLFFSIPLIIPIIFISLTFDINYIWFSLLCGLLAFILEYLYGKLMDILFGSQYWTYSYLTIDGNHTSPTNFFGAIVAGYLFPFVFLLGILIW